MDAVTQLWDVHTLPGTGPVRHFGHRLDQSGALRSAGRLTEVLGLPLVVEAIDDAAWLARLLGREVAG